MKTIGFGGTFYTLWDISSATVWVDAYHQREVTNYVYHKNLSKDLGAAETKLMSQFNSEYRIDLSVKGTKSYSVRGEIKECYPDDTFPSGRAQGMKIAVSNDVYHLELQAEDGRTQERKDLAYARLVELGLWDEFNGVRMSIIAIEQAKFEATLVPQIAGHHHQNGAKVKLTLKLLSQRSFDGTYGRCYIQEFQSATGEVYKYMGSAPQDLQVRDEVEMIATIKHDHYYGEQDMPETKLNRIKITKWPVVAA